MKRPRAHADLSDFMNTFGPAVREAAEDAGLIKTKANTEFMDWWPLLNAETKRQGWGEAGYSDAKGCWEVGDSPETAAQQLIVCWSSPR